MDPADIANRFTYHAPATPDRADAHDAIRDACHNFAGLINDLCPNGREKSTAVAKIEEAMFWANAAIARQG